MNSFIVSFFLLFLISCSKSEKLKVSVNFQTVFALEASGGLMVWGKRKDGQSSFAYKVEGQKLELTLPYGIWNFYAIGWKGDGNGPLSGETICDQTQTKIDDISSNEVSLNLKKDKCRKDPFSIEEAPTLKICDNITGQKCNDPGIASSYRISIATFNKIGVLPQDEEIAIKGGVSIDLEGIQSNCIKINSVDDQKFLRIPFGNDQTKKLFGIKIEFFRQSQTCSYDDSFEKFAFDGGLSNKFSGPDTVSKPNREISFEIQDDPCFGNEEKFFAGGEGTKTEPYLICDSTQLLNVITHAAVKPKSHYKLLKNIDLKNVDVSNRPWNVCLTDQEDTFYPIGYQGNCTKRSIFEGTFDGNFKKISGLKMTKDSFVGLFGETKGALIKNLQIGSPQINGNSSLGTIAGKSQNTEFENITVENLEISEAPPGIVGSIGGLVGQSTNDEAFKILINAKKINAPNANSVGGLIGRSENSDISLSRFTGTILGSQWVGGIMGQAFKESSIKNTYVHGRVESTYFNSAGVNLKQGGILGGSHQKPKIQYNYFYGELVHQCGFKKNCDIFPIGNGADDTNFYPDSPNIRTIQISDDQSSKVSLYQFLSRESSFNTTTLGKKLNITGSEYKLITREGDIPRFDFELDSRPCSEDQSSKLFAGGDGSEGNPYLICTANQLLNVIDQPAEELSKSYKLLSDIDLRDGKEALTKREYKCLFDNHTFLPIGYKSDSQSCDFANSFRGTFDGNMKSISGLILGTNSGAHDYVGLFAKTLGATIKNLKLIAPKIIGKSYVGTIAGQSDNTTFKNIVIERLDLADLNVQHQIEYGKYFGGLVGQSNVDIISEILISGNIHSKSSSFIGGIAGSVVGESLEKSRFEGMISAHNFVGGIVGEAHSTIIKNNYVHGIIESITTEELNQGGIVGSVVKENPPKIEYNYFYGRFLKNCVEHCKIYPIAQEADGSNFYVKTQPTKDYSSDSSTPMNKDAFLSNGSALKLSDENAAILNISYEKYSLVNKAGDIPRFEFESNMLNLFSMHPCRKFEAYIPIVDQISDTQGTYLVCNQSQFEDSQEYTNKKFTFTNYVFMHQSLSGSQSGSNDNEYLEYGLLGEKPADGDWQGVPFLLVPAPSN